ncbi:MAG: nucleoside deaminase [Ignavibacteria bacterium]|nr:nucleoside deaminase [Ignavibacteria bacterium]
MENIHLKWMMQALFEAEIAFKKNEVPIGCVIVYNNKIIAKAHNLVETLKDPTAHAEILCITSAAEYLGKKYLNESDMYVTVEPCPMCAGAIMLARISNLYFGAFDSKYGACGSIINIPEKKEFNHNCNVYGGIMDKEASDILKRYFIEKR